MASLVELSALETVTALRGREVSPVELIDVAEERIALVEPVINALPTTFFDRARAHAAQLREPPDPPPWYLHGLPIAVKDLHDVAGVVTTRGCVLDVANVATRSDIMVETLETNGAIPIAKSNVPEHGAGSHTFNEVFGPTRNPWDTIRSAGGSSGGSAAALATGEVWLATGSDLGGSLRNPASFCGVIGLRPRPGRIARGPVSDPWNALSVRGPMGRTVADTALMLDAMAGAHPEDPISLPRPTRTFLDAALAPERPRRVAFSADLGGITPVDPQVAAACRAAVERMAGEGVVVNDAAIDFSGAAEAFHVLRALGFARDHVDLLAHRDVVKPEVIWNIEAGLRLTPSEIAGAMEARGALYARMAEFFSTYDLLLCPAAIVPPFPIGWRWPTEVDGTALEQYIDWLLICSAISLTSSPAISVPCGVTRSGLPVGLQMVAAPHDEHGLLSAAAWWEQLGGLVGGVPRDPNVG